MGSPVAFCSSLQCDTAYPWDHQTGPMAHLLPHAQSHTVKPAMLASVTQHLMVWSENVHPVHKYICVEAHLHRIGPWLQATSCTMSNALEPACSRWAAPWLTCRLMLWSEVLHTVQVGQIDPALVGCRAVLIVLLHVQAVQADINSVQLLKQ